MTEQQTQVIELESPIFGVWTYACPLDKLDAVLEGFAALGWVRK